MLRGGVPWSLVSRALLAINRRFGEEGGLVPGGVGGSMKVFLSFVDLCVRFPVLFVFVLCCCFVCVCVCVRVCVSLQIVVVVVVG